MATRVLSGAAGCWLGLYLLGYVWVVADQDGEVAIWYIALGAIALVACVVAAAGVAPSMTTTTALVLTAILTLAGMLTTGLLLLPAVVALTVAVFLGPLVSAPRRSRRPVGNPRKSL